MSVSVSARWWADLYASKEHLKFHQDVTEELRRMEQVGGRAGAGSGSVSVLSSSGELGRAIDMSNGAMPAKWAGGAGSEKSVLQKIRSLVDFQMELFRSSKSFVDAQTFISERPEVLVNTLVEHIRYLFGIKTLQGMLPRMNEVYLFSEEMCNFISNARQMMNMSNLPDATVLTEIYRRIKSGEPAKKPVEEVEDETLASSSAVSVVSEFVDDDDSVDYLANS